jgi:hypothetical protein
MTGDDTAAIDSRHQVVGEVLRDLAFAVKALQLYPASSPVVREAVSRAHSTLLPHLRQAPLSLGVLPESLHVGEAGVEDEARGVRHLAERLHQRGVAQLHIDSSLSPASLQRLAELLAMNAEVLHQGGGISGHLEREHLSGLSVEMLRLDRLYEEERDEWGEEGASVWEMLLHGYGDAHDVGDIDWEALAQEPEQLEGFLKWLLESAVEDSALAEYSRVEIVRTVCQNVGEAATHLGTENLDKITDVLARFYDDLDQELWIDLLTDPLTVGEVDSSTTARSEFTGIPGITGSGGVDLSQHLASALSGAQVQDLVTYALTTRREASPRLFQLLDRVLEMRPDRDVMAQAIRDAVERQAQKDGSRRSFSELWPDLGDVLQQENPDPYVNRPYRATLDELLREEAPTSVWPIERIEPRMREMEPVYLLQRRARVIMRVIEVESDDDEYRALAIELERSFPEFILQGQYIATEEVLEVFARHLDPASGRTVEQRQVAREILLRFCNQHTLREVVRNLAGKPRTQIDAATRIFQSLGPMAIPALLEALSQEASRPIRLHLVRMLSAMGDAALPEIQKHLRDQRWFFVRNLVWIIGEIGEPRFARYLGLIADHDDLRVRQEVIKALAKLGGTKAAEFLVEALEDPDEGIQLIAIRGIGRSGVSPPVPELHAVLRRSNFSGQNTDFIQAAAVALGRLGDVEALASLRRVARRGPFLFRSRRLRATEAARWAISSILGEDVGAAPDVEPQGFEEKPPSHDESSESGDDGESRPAREDSPERR